VGHAAPTRHSQKKCPDTGRAGAVLPFPKGYSEAGNGSPRTALDDCLFPRRPDRNRFAQGVAEMPPRPRRDTLMTGQVRLMTGQVRTETAHDNAFELWRPPGRHFGLHYLRQSSMRGWRLRKLLRHLPPARRRRRTAETSPRKGAPSCARTAPRQARKTAAPRPRRKGSSSNPSACVATTLTRPEPRVAPRPENRRRVTLQRRLPDGARFAQEPRGR
jgi:hypothetical protein